MGGLCTFMSQATNLITPAVVGTPAYYQVYVHERQTGAIELISVANDGTKGNAYSWDPSISGDGRFVAFRSISTNLIPADANRTGANLNGWDIFVRDRVAGTTERISVASDGTEAINGISQEPIITPDGRYVTFESTATNLVPGGTGQRHIYVHDRLSGTTELLSIATDGTPGNGLSGYDKDISADARYVGFRSLASNLVPGDTNGTEDIILRDRGPAVGIGGMTTTSGSCQFMVAGWATFAGVLLVAAEDPPDDGASTAVEMGGELVGASIAYRPELADIFIRLRLKSLPSVRGPSIDPDPLIFPPGALAPGIAGLPGVIYGFSLETDVRYEVRAGRANGPDPFSVPPQFTLYRCAPLCVQTTVLKGGLGTTGDEVVVAIPLQALGVAQGGALSNLRAFTAMENEGTTPLDEMLLSGATIPVHTVSLGIAPAGTQEAEVGFDTTATLANGNFSGILDGRRSSGDYDVWARACLGTVCGPAASSAVTIDPACVPTPVQLDAVVSRKEHGPANPFDLTLPLTGSPGIECRSGGASNQHTLVFTFANPLTSVGGASVTGGTGTVSSSAIGSNTRQYFVNLESVTNAQIITVTLANVNDAAGQVSAAVPISMAVLLGDTTGNGNVNSSDIGQAKGNSGQSASAANFKADVTVNGTINSSDIGTIKAQSGTALP